MLCKKLIQRAIDARENAYAPYSGFTVGAAVKTDKGIFTGCNVENASYGASNCAERTAIFKAVSEGARKIHKIVIVGGTTDSDEINSFAYPCGICRQVMAEFCDDDCDVIIAKSVDDYEVFKFGELFPKSFNKSSL